MSVTNGQDVNAAVTNAAFVSKTTDSTSVGKLTLNKVSEGSQVESVQKAVNKIYEGVGTTGQDDTAINDYANNNFITDGDSRKVAIEKLDTQAFVQQTQANTLEGRLDVIEFSDSTFDGNKTFLDNVVVGGSLTVNGTLTTINSTVLDVTDPNITINNGGDDFTSEGAGITIERTGVSGSIKYDSTIESRFKLGDLGAELEIVTVDDNQTLTNKDLTSPVVTGLNISDFQENAEVSTPLTPSSGFRRLYAKSDGWYDLNSSGLETKFGSGSGSGGGSVNLITNGNADEASVSIFNTYADAASSRPEDGTGGTTDLTSSVSAVNPLTGTKSFILTKTTSNNLGHGWSIPFTVDKAYRAKVLNIKVKYLLVNGNLTAGTTSTDSDLIWYIYDVTNSQLIQPSSFKMLSNSTSISDEFVGTFQTSSTGTDYRLIAHITTSALTDFNLKVEVEVSPSTYSYGTPVTDWQSFTPTGAWTTNTTYTGRFRRVGDTREYQYIVSTSGAPTATALTVNLPSGHIIDTSKMTILSNEEILPSASARVLDVGTAFYTATVVYNNTTSVRLKYIDTSTAFGNQNSITNTAPMVWAASDTINFSFSVPIVGLSSSVQMSDQTDTRIVSAKLIGNTPSTSAGSVLVAGVSYDTHGGFSLGRYTIPVSGFYHIHGNERQSTSVSFTLYIYVNGSLTEELVAAASTEQLSKGFSTTRFHNAGDIIDIRPNATITLTQFTFAIDRVAGPNQIAASESVNMRYTATSGQSLASGVNTIQFPTKNYDSHGLFSSNTTFTAQISGKYSVNAKIAVNTIAGLSTNYIRFLVNGSNVSEDALAMNYSTASPFTFKLRDELNLNAGDTLTVQFQNGFGTTITVDSGVGRNSLSISRIGN